MEDLILYSNPMSRGRIARWMLEEVGAPYRVEMLAYGEAMKSPAFRAINPMGKVPTIVHSGAVVTECAAICAYLADAFPQAGLAPAPADRAAYYRWLFFAAGPLEAAVSNKALGVVLPPERERMVGYGNYALVLDTLETALAGRDFIAGDRFTAADVYVGAHLQWGLQFGSIEKRPVFESYAEKLAARPAAMRATALDDAEAAAMHRPG
ncbi:glutathione S-transferase family protein [Bosea sp. (in: a-proteobacteria)]|uniref:glutathione S-transferase family protein n=1 Tax=Bosea sp. (in: a-proteobacteria) TaxID=1871050 RepID=UPI003B3AF928